MPSSSVEKAIQLWHRGDELRDELDKIDLELEAAIKCLTADEYILYLQTVNNKNN